MVTTTKMAYQIFLSDWCFSKRLTKIKPTNIPKGMAPSGMPIHAIGCVNRNQSVPSKTNTTSFKK